MNAFIILVSNGPTVVITRLNPQKTVANLIWRGFRDFNLYQINPYSLEEFRNDIGKISWDKTIEELNDEWPVRVIDRDSSRAFLSFQLFALDIPVAKVRDRKTMEININH